MNSNLQSPKGASWPRRCAAALATLAVTWLAGAASPAAIVVSGTSNSTSQSFFDGNILTNDLGASAVVTGVLPSLGSLGGFNDGAASPTGNSTSATVTNDAYYDGTAGFGTKNLLASNPSVTFTFNTGLGGSASGYAISRISSIYGWHDHASMSNQNYSVSYSTVSNPGTFTPLTSVAYSPFDPANDTAPAGGQNHSSQVNITNPDGPLASNVAAVRVTFSSYRNANNVAQAGQLVREFDIVSTSVVAPPSGPTILPLGDSITDGFGTPGGYRIKLYSNLNGNVRFVGSQSNGPGTLPDKRHEGHSGYRIDQITGNLNGLVSSSPAPNTNNGGYWLTGGHGTGRDALDPDIVLLHIGTNDASQGASALVMQQRLTQLLTDLKSYLPDTQFIVASLILRTDSQSAEAVQAQYNAAIPGIVSQFGPNFHFLDMRSVLNAADLADGVHPNLTGYNKMADAWAAAIASVPEPASFSAMTVLAVVMIGRRHSDTLRKPSSGVDRGRRHFESVSAISGPPRTRRFLRLPSQLVSRRGSHWMTSRR